MQDDDPGWLERLLGPDEDVNRSGEAILSTTFYLVFNKRSEALGASEAVEVALAGDEPPVIEGPTRTGDVWTVFVILTGVPKKEQRARLEDLAHQHNGTFEGEVVGPLSK